MRPDVHAAALRSAAKLVLGMASIASVTAACASESTDETGASTDAVMAKNDNAKSANDKTDPAVFDGHVDGGTTAACKTTLESAFPNPSFEDYGHATPQPKGVLDCCNAELTSQGAETEYRWACCFAYDENAKVSTKEDGTVNPWSAPTLSHTHAWACTPWGPPVPPPMNRAKCSKKLSPARRDMNAFLAAMVA